MISIVKSELTRLLEEIGIKGEFVFSEPPKKEMGDLALPCFVLAKEIQPAGRQGSKNPAEVALEIKNKMLAFLATPGKAAKKHLNIELIEKVDLMGPYVNFYLSSNAVADLVLKELNEQKENFGKNESGKNEKVIVEFAQPNTHKAFHIGHLRGTVTGESLARILENSGFEVVRANYQGDVGMHIAKALWALGSQKSKVKSLKSSSIEERVKFLGEMYATGAQAFENDEKAKEEILLVNEQIYSGDKEIKDLYDETRAWSLEYFDGIYKMLGTHFDRLYFESEMFARGVQIVKELKAKNVFKESEGAIIFEGSKYDGLHDRVFLNSKGLPTYEAKEMALAEKQFSEYNPDKIIHVVAKEQTDYFKVVFKALEEVLPKSKGKEMHLPYGWVNLKSGKMSSRTGNVVLGEWVISEVNAKILEIMKENEISNKQETAKKVSVGAVKYAFLKTGIKNDISFDFDESVSLTGDSGPYLLYIVARIKSILNKAGAISVGEEDVEIPANVAVEEKRLAMKLADFAEVTAVASVQTDPSKIAQYLFDLAQIFNNFYHACPVLKAEEKEKIFRLNLIKSVEQIMTRGLYLLGIETVEQM